MKEAEDVFSETSNVQKIEILSDTNLWSFRTSRFVTSRWSVYAKRKSFDCMLTYFKPQLYRSLQTVAFFCP